MHPLTPARLPHVIANQCAHWRGNPFSPQRNLASWHYFWQIRSTFPYSPKVLLSVMPCRRGYGLPRRFAPRNDMQKLAACAHGKDVMPGKFVTPHEFALSTAVLLCPAAGRSGLSRRCAPRNDMQKENRFCGCKNVVPNDMLKLAACPCNTGALPVYCRNSPLQPGQTALRFSTAPAPGHPSLRILQALPCFSGKTVAFFRKMCYTMLSIIRF